SRPVRSSSPSLLVTFGVRHFRPFVTFAVRLRAQRFLCARTFFVRVHRYFPFWRGLEPATRRLWIAPGALAASSSLKPVAWRHLSNEVTPSHPALRAFRVRGFLPHLGVGAAEPVRLAR